jgi:hypothetical protein
MCTPQSRTLVGNGGAARRLTRERFRLVDLLFPVRRPAVGFGRRMGRLLKGDSVVVRSAPRARPQL